jgi:hypothetical protein
MSYIFGMGRVKRVVAFSYNGVLPKPQTGLKLFLRNSSYPEDFQVYNLTYNSAILGPDLTQLSRVAPLGQIVVRQISLIFCQDHSCYKLRWLVLQNVSSHETSTLWVPTGLKDTHTIGEGSHA